MGSLRDQNATYLSSAAVCVFLYASVHAVLMRVIAVGIRLSVCLSHAVIENNVCSSIPK